MIKYTTQEIQSHVLSNPEGAHIAREGSHEARVWSALPMKGEGKPLEPKELKQKVGDETAKIGQGIAFKNGWIGKEGAGFVKLVRRIARLCYGSRSQLTCFHKVPAIRDTTQLELREVDSTGTLQSGEKALAALRKRKLIVQKLSCLRIPDSSI